MRFGLAGLVLLLPALIAPASAGAARRAAPAPGTTLQLGPLRAAGGFSVYVTELGCGGPSPTLEVTYLRTAGPAQLLHRYEGVDGACRIVGSRRAPTGATLSANVPGQFSVSVRVGRVRSALRHPGLPVGCGTPYGPERPARARGNVVLAIHRAIFGRISATTVDAQLFPGAPQACPPTVPANVPQLLAAVDGNLIDAELPGRGTHRLQVTAPDGDQPAANLTGTLEFSLTGPRAALTGANGTVTLGTGSAFSRGSMHFSPLPLCPHATAQNGNLSGNLQFTDPVLGAITVVGPDAQQAYLGSGAAQPGGCNGPGSQPVSPAIISSCNLADSNCSVAANTNTATLFDETSPGTQTITSETINFGDGSPPVPIANYGNVSHTYAAAGTYTATVTVTTNTDQTSTATTSVVIDP